ncbi:MAG: hypothetical protein PF448_11450 [Bacteroidales bacterium]|nr:hypothetical protein [Bacteroidales bacterium]
MKNFLLLIAPTILFIACNKPAQTNENTKEDTVQETIDSLQPEMSFTKDSIHDQIAHYLSGSQMDLTEAKGKLSDEEWNEYSTTISKNWSMIEEKRLSTMRQWVSDYFSEQINDTMQLFYPFSGPDFLHAYTLFPNANDYVFLANEKIGLMPDFKTMTSQQHKNYLHNIDFFLRDIYKRSYFITGNMIKDIGSEKVEGVLPIFYVFLSRTGHEILDVEAVKVEDDGILSVYSDSVIIPNDEYRGVRFFFRENGENRVKTLTYFYCDISNNGFVKHPELELYLKGLRQSNGFVKSASYLMHYNTFSSIREILMDKTQSLFQDDTGIPFKYFDKDAHEFVLFGKYEKPISDFSANLTQTDLKQAYSSEDYDHEDLPFSLGYHWYTNNQNYMLIRKN